MVLSPEDQFPSHNEGCFREWVTGINYSTGKIIVVPSFRRRWNCDGCLPKRITQTVGHILMGSMPVASAWEDETGPIRDRVRGTPHGYFALSVEASSRFVVSDPQVLDKPAESGIELAREVFDIGTENGIKRVSYGGSWEADQSPAKYFTWPNRTRRRAEVMRAIEDAGYGDRSVPPADIQLAQRRIQGFVEGIESDW